MDWTIWAGLCLNIKILLIYKRKYNKKKIKKMKYRHMHTNQIKKNDTNQTQETGLGRFAIWPVFCSPLTVLMGLSVGEVDLGMVCMKKCWWLHLWFLYIPFLDCAHPSSVSRRSFYETIQSENQFCRISIHWLICLVIFENLTPVFTIWFLFRLCFINH